MSTSDMESPLQRDGVGLELCFTEPVALGRDYSSVREMSVRWQTRI
jgi:hypothetical protein